ncbi:hypothetical protein GUITHDRAFT_121823 [Guillardia theta CCMP2712]|uniref:Tafazzin family protein n=1 Tax=Guillardia theta (strain CCMP2712) TaxID=905079 RepID=L1I7X6_GUITC|nr:hypothetical protein GUITHDRAFT_121823 [Guillardia theta CCMP2712]EKX32004.1 hypothetical protein GUITHDRAFT_121823 [Guillardia theta CCMP2712]|eukprot:XP_005818984.1 hypothetical protein GUITHDRAFT_121823 [Guillardia theta CCMP2712]
MRASWLLLGLIAAHMSMASAFAPSQFVQLNARGRHFPSQLSQRVPPRPKSSGGFARTRMSASSQTPATGGGAASRSKGTTSLLSLTRFLLVKFLILLREIYGQLFVFVFDTFIQKPFMYILNKVEIKNHDRLTKLISSRPRGAPLITVSNHCSSLDEPLLFSTLIPWPIKQWELRYSLCHDGMFFRLGPIFAQLFFYAARGLPIYRNRNMDQEAFRIFAEKARKGGWCHIFPEGRIWQPWKLRNEDRRLGPLRPGVGKLIAYCEEQSPIVLPFYHTGMHRVLPQFPNSRAQSFPPKTGNKVTIRIGEPIHVKDLLDEYRQKREEARKEHGIEDAWTTTSVEEELYAKLTNRVEEALLKLSQEVNVEEEWQTHPSVLSTKTKK